MMFGLLFVVVVLMPVSYRYYNALLHFTYDIEAWFLLNIEVTNKVQKTAVILYCQQVSCSSRVGESNAEFIICLNI